VLSRGWTYNDHKKSPVCEGTGAYTDIRELGDELQKGIEALNEAESNKVFYITFGKDSLENKKD